MALQTFTAGQVLTAAQVTALQSNDFNQTVSTKTASYTLVALDKGTRVVMNSASATTITVNTSLFDAGDTLQIHNIGAGVCTITAGTATVSTAGSLALATNAGGTLYFTSTGVAIFFPTVASSSASGLELISTTSFSAVSSVSAPASTFTATYQAYKILLTMSASSTSMDVSFKYRAAGSDLTNNYYGAFTGRDNANNSVTWAINNAAAAKVSEQSTNTKRYFLLDMTLEAPQLTGSKPATFNLCGTTSVGGFILAGSGAFVQDITGTAADSCSFIASSGNFTGQMVIFGFSK